MMVYLPEKSFIDNSETKPIEDVFLGVKIKIVPGQLGSLPAHVALELKRFHPEVHEVINHPTTPKDYPDPPSLIIE